MNWLYDFYSKAHINTACTLVSVAFAVLAQSSYAVDTPYMAECRAQGVPIPPDWAETGTPWINQGNLRTGSNLLQPGQDAFVWTYSDPSVRGACIALPRGSGVGSLAGIICQSATTGAACFWDNRKRDDNDPLRQVPSLGWLGQQLKISELKDATNLTEPGSGICTECHRGNNVFLISPDDPTWDKVLRGPLVTSPGSTFTTRVEASRYVPITSLAGQPPRPGWDNAFQAGGCAGACHENPALGFSNIPNPMPPNCAAGGVENCYGSPSPQNPSPPNPSPQNNLVWLPAVLDLLLN